MATIQERHRDKAREWLLKYEYLTVADDHPSCVALAQMRAELEEETLERAAKIAGNMATCSQTHAENLRAMEIRDAIRSLISGGETK